MFLLSRNLWPTKSHRDAVSGLWPLPWSGGPFQPPFDLCHDVQVQRVGILCCFHNQRFAFAIWRSGATNVSSPGWLLGLCDPQLGPLLPIGSFCQRSCSASTFCQSASFWNTCCLHWLGCFLFLCCFLILLLLGISLFILDLFLPAQLCSKIPALGLDCSMSALVFS